MSKNWIRVVAAGLFCLPLALAASGQGDLEQARMYFERAQGEGISKQERLEWLERSLATYPTFLASYELGKSHREASAHHRALEHFQKAFDLTEQDEYLARAAYQIGMTHERMNHYVEARRWLRKSLGFGDHDAARGALRDLELSRKDRIVPADEILRELKVERSFGVAKAELRVNFELNRASLDSRGHAQAVELGKALSDRRLQSRGETFFLFGHTDRLCPRGRDDREGCDRHNLGLSLQRATTVRRVLTHELGLAPERIQAIGCGREYLLSGQAAAEDHYLNRRVVVVAADPSAGGSDQLCGHDSGLF